jgi:hypothetical protein
MRAQGDGEVRRREDVRKKTTKPATTLFVVNFDVDRVRERDLERHFEPYGKLKRVQIKRNYGAAACMCAHARPLCCLLCQFEPHGKLQRMQIRRNYGARPHACPLCHMLRLMIAVTC